MYKRQGVVKLPGLNAGRTGLTEQAAKDAGHDVVSVVAVVDDKAHYYPGADSFLVKMIADKTTGEFPVSYTHLRTLCALRLRTVL